MFIQKNSTSNNEQLKLDINNKKKYLFDKCFSDNTDVILVLLVILV